MRVVVMFLVGFGLVIEMVLETRGSLDAALYNCMYDVWIVVLKNMSTGRRMEGYIYPAVSFFSNLLASS